MSTVDPLDEIVGLCDHYEIGSIDENGTWYCANCGWSAAAHERAPIPEDDDDGA